MKQEDHPNHVSTNRITHEDHQKIWAHTEERALAERRAKEFAEQWPATAIKAICALLDRVTALETRVARLDGSEG